MSLNCGGDGDSAGGDCAIAGAVAEGLKPIRSPSLTSTEPRPGSTGSGIAGSVLNAVDVEAGKEERVWVRILGADYAFQTKLWSRFDPSTGEIIWIKF